jgi:ribA/ribD-fused uncharacterized protein
MAIEFNSKSPHYSEFSNFYHAPFEINNVTWPTVENYFQAQKFPTDPILQERIRLASPQVAKRLGRTKTHHFRRDWDSCKEDVMLTALQAKFQHPDRMALLQSTGRATLKEKSARDSYWGGTTKTAKNRMGILLASVRDSLPTQ